VYRYVVNLECNTAVVNRGVRH